MLCAGGAYLATASHGRFSQAWPLEWVLFCLAYFLYYFFGNFACFLIATQEINFYSQVGIFTRILNLALALLLLFGGFGISGLVISVLISFASGALLYRRKVQKIIADADEVESGDAHDHAHIRLHHVGMHALYILGTYGAYRIGLMVDASGGGDTAHQASYGLALQIFALINILSAVPLTMRVTPLVRAAESGRQEVLLPEIGRLGVLVNAVFLTSAGGFAVASWAVPQVFPTITASMPDTAEVIMLSAAFWVEINILILVNVLLAVQDFRFCWNYFRTLAISLSIGVGSWMLGAPFVISFILIPLIGQAAIGFPTLMHLVRSRFGFGFRSYVRAASDGAIILARALGQIALRE